MIITVKHNFETAHRLPFLEGKCESIHGHSWWVEWFIDAPMDENGLTVEYGSVKKQLRTWVDEFLDHGTMLGVEDALLPAFIADGSKVYVFGQQDKMHGYQERPWPTVEAVAELLAVVAHDLVPEGQIRMVKVQETHVNKAVWMAPSANVTIHQEIHAHEG
jgi:6-pyruvoyltetrahydropterin/6-carboxytetrahydropterin synthase